MSYMRTRTTAARPLHGVAALGQADTWFVVESAGVSSPFVTRAEAESEFERQTPATWSTAHLVSVAPNGARTILRKHVPAKKWALLVGSAALLWLYLCAAPRQNPRSRASVMKTTRDLLDVYEDQGEMPEGQLARDRAMELITKHRLTWRELYPKAAAAVASERRRRDREKRGRQPLRAPRSRQKSWLRGGGRLRKPGKAGARRKR